MKPIEFEGMNAVYGAKQPEYQPLPAMVDDGRVVSCWELSPDELKVVQETGKIWLSVFAQGMPLQPVFLCVEEPGEIGATCG